MLVLGIESSCDETAVALVRGDRSIAAQRVASQDEAHRPFGGVVPELAARAHVDRLTPMVADVLAEAGVTLADVDAVAATAGPGLIGGVMVGLVTGKALAFAAGKPLLAINHLEGHALSPRLADASLQFPYLLLLVSGGHCQLLGVEGVGRYRRLATTIDDAIGEAFDKTAKVLGLGFPGGPAVERAAARGNPRRFALPRPLRGSDEPHFSFAGLKSAVLRQWQALVQPVHPVPAGNPTKNPVQLALVPQTLGLNVPLTSAMAPSQGMKEAAASSMVRLMPLCAAKFPTKLKGESAFPDGDTSSKPKSPMAPVWLMPLSFRTTLVTVPDTVFAGTVMIDG